MDTVKLSDGARLATWTVPGPADRPAVILVHGGPGLWDYLRPLGDLLADFCTVHRYDQRGCGHSSPSDDQTLERSVADIEELRIAFGHEQVVLIGHSFGATLALAHAGNHPDRVSALGYVSGVGIGDWRTPSRAEEARRRAPWAARFADLDNRERTRAEEIEWRRIQWASDYADPVRGHDLCLDMAMSPHAVNRHANRALRASDAEQIAWAEAVRCPITFLHGAVDPRPVETVRALTSHAPQSQLQVLEGAGHLPWVEQPAAVRRVLHAVVASARPTALH